MRRINYLNIKIDMSHYFTSVTVENMNQGSPAALAIKKAPVEFRQDSTAAVYYVTLHIDGTNAHRLEEDMEELKFAFDGFGEAKLFRVDEVCEMSVPGFLVAIPNGGKPPLMGALTGRVTIQRLPKEFHAEGDEDEGEGGEGGGDGGEERGSEMRKRNTTAEAPAKGKKKAAVGRLGKQN